MKKVLTSLALVLMLVAVMAVPAMAAEEVTLPASVSVDQLISITLTDAGTSGINFGSVTPPITGVGDTDQSDGTPAVGVKVESETNVNVDLGIKGAATGALALSNWKYSTTFAGTKTSLPVSYAAFDTDVTPGTSSPVYHWVDVPSGTASGSQGCTVSYKAIATGGSF